ncbi:MAG: integrase [archaeon GB-1867-005]|nr:integrase [Candidatus Culexmicrobium cathedralense]
MKRCASQSHSTLKGTLGLEDFKRYCFERYSRWHARNIYRYAVKYALQILEDPSKAIILKRLTFRVSRYVLESASVLLQYLKLKGVNVDVDLSLLRKHINRDQKIRVLDFEGDHSIVEEAIRQVTESSLGPTLKLVAITAFFTGLRSPELRFMFEKWRDLRKIEYDNVSVVELGYDRGKKKAWITMMPSELAVQIKPVKLGWKLAEHLREKGVKLSILRKSHVAMLSTHLNPAEIDLLQGRLNKVLVKHYIKHLRSIAKRYREAIKPKMRILLKESRNI